MRSAVEKLIAKARRNGRYVRDSILPGPRVVLDLSPDTLQSLLASVRHHRMALKSVEMMPTEAHERTERLLVEALEKAR